MNFTDAKQALLDVEPSIILPKPEHIKFYKPILTGKKRNIFKGVAVDTDGFISLLYSLGYRRINVDKSIIYAKVSNNRILTEVTRQDMIDDFFEYLKNVPDERIEVEDDEPVFITQKMLRSKFIEQISYIFTTDKLNMLIPLDTVIFAKDTFSTKYFYYTNGYVEISKQNVVFLEYSNLKHYIWNTQVIQRDFSPTAQKSVFEDFMYKIAFDNSTRVQQLKIITGYLLHTYTNTKLKAIVFTDSTQSINNEANGRTGKTLYTKALSYMLNANQNDKNHVEINGKAFDVGDKHRYQNCNYNTSLIVLNDLKRGFNLEYLYNDITEGVSVEPKGQASYIIKPKMIITTNQVVRSTGDSSADRIVEIEFSSYFSKSHTPEQEYGHWFFRDWNSTQWSCFDSFMISCVKAFFDNNNTLIEPDLVNLTNRKLYEYTSEEFVDFMDDLLELGTGREYKYDRSDLYTRFLHENPHVKIGAKLFNTFIKYYTKYKENLVEFNPEVHYNKSMGKRYVWFELKVD